MTQSLQIYVNDKNTFDWRHCRESVDVTPEEDTFCKGDTICRDTAPPHFVLEPLPLSCNETIVRSTMQHRKPQLACCLLYNKPQSSGFNYVYLVMIIQ